MGMCGGGGANKKPKHKREMNRPDSLILATLWSGTYAVSKSLELELTVACHCWAALDKLGGTKYPRSGFYSTLPLFLQDWTWGHAGAFLYLLPSPETTGIITEINSFYFFLFFQTKKSSFEKKIKHQGLLLPFISHEKNREYTDASSARWKEAVVIYILRAVSWDN